eukprot:m.587332 g.587332  ORF g.587332 m.587332 type:complete len:111 (+) comp22351_c1_seq1:2153-2485(+)
MQLFQMLPWAFMSRSYMHFPERGLLRPTPRLPRRYDTVLRRTSLIWSTLPRTKVSSNAAARWCNTSEAVAFEPNFTLAIGRVIMDIVVSHGYTPVLIGMSCPFDNQDLHS